MPEHSDLDAHHLAFAKRANARCWELLERTGRTASDDRELLEAAFASAWHWRHVGTALNEQRAEWLLARVYAVLGDAVGAQHHAERCWALTEELGLVDFDRAYALEARYRACLVAGDEARAAELRSAALAAVEGIANDRDRAIFLSDLG